MRPTFRYPFDGSFPVSSPYGPRGGGMHTGTDFGVPAGVAILASNDGQVIYCAYEAGGAGNTVTISGADGWQSRYHHMERWVVYTGQSVHAGQVVGYCDNTGSSTGPHLHFEIRPSPGETTDPIPILEADAGQLPGGPTAPDQPDEDYPEDDTMLIIDTDTGDAAILFGTHRPRKIPSVNAYQRGTFVTLDHAAWMQYWDDALALYQAATR